MNWMKEEKKNHAQHGGQLPHSSYPACVICMV